MKKLWRYFIDVYLPECWYWTKYWYKWCNPRRGEDCNDLDCICYKCREDHCECAARNARGLH